MTNQELEQEFKVVLKRWLDENPETTPDIRMSRYFFWAGAELGLRKAREIYSESQT